MEIVMLMSNIPHRYGTIRYTLIFWIRRAAIRQATHAWPFRARRSETYTAVAAEYGRPSKAPVHLLAGLVAEPGPYCRNLERLKVRWVALGSRLVEPLFDPMLKEHLSGLWGIITRRIHSAVDDLHRDVYNCYDPHIILHLGGWDCTYGNVPARCLHVSSVLVIAPCSSSSIDCYSWARFY